MVDLPDIMKVGAPMPPSIGRCADLYHDVREIRLAMEKEVAEVKARETEIQEHIINTLGASDDTGAAGLRYRAQIVKDRKPRISEDKGGWPIFWTWIRKNDFSNMVQRRINEKALEEYMADNPERTDIPGCEMVQVKKLSITKIG
jgi:hypothetical protein